MNKPSPWARSAPTGTGDRLELMQTFVRIVEAGSLSQAAAQMHTTQPTVSRRLQALERSLGLRLLQRSTRAMRLTEDGERCYERAKALIDSWDALEAEARGVGEHAKGRLRVLVPHAFGQEQLVLPLTEFLRQHPEVDVDWLLRDDVHDLIGAGIDCALQVGEIRDPSVVAIKLTDVPRIVVASPALLKRSRQPREVADLAQLPWLALSTYYRNEVSLTHLRTGAVHRFDIQPRMSTDNLYALRQAAVLGLGVGIGSKWMMEADLAAGRLVHLMPEWQAPHLPLHLIYPHARYYPVRLRRFIDAMRGAMPSA
ncbi:LysR family transcriptional regulator [Hydrogenophaga sp. BPS33]|uniref:LysR family transcriptional regulator n=1 Tax=Hydrogenophaga sp. BPS33 TaxID=2651974 RepID=UPI0013200525|nr:LysR family transcriptional regulator [Hydrogenophaga sp. BPS33]QHE86790.1 LysR family transcriptional regulator [Hydrogenophaga sp. BPS33]